MKIFAIKEITTNPKPEPLKNIDLSETLHPKTPVTIYPEHQFTLNPKPTPNRDSKLSALSANPSNIAFTCYGNNIVKSK